MADDQTETAWTVGEAFWQGRCDHQHDPLFEHTKLPLVWMPPSTDHRGAGGESATTPTPEGSTAAAVGFIMGFCNVALINVSGGGAARGVKRGDSFTLVDAGSALGALHICEQLDRHLWSVGARVTSVIATHGHLDHIGGIDTIESQQRLALQRGGFAERDDGATDGVQVAVWGHSHVNRRLQRYKLTSGYNARINARQFGLRSLAAMEAAFGETRSVTCPYDTMTRGVDETTAPLSWDASTNVAVVPKAAFRPSSRGTAKRIDAAPSSSGLTGSTTLRLCHTLGETDDCTYVYDPASRVLITGDLFINNVPNCGNPQKQQRYLAEWAEALLSMAKLDAATLLPGHGPMILGADRVREALTDTATFLKDIFDQTLTLINANVPLNDVVRRVSPNQDLMGKRPYLRPYYDDPSFLVHGLYRRYAGWYSGFIGDLHPAANSDIGRSILHLTSPCKEEAAAVDLFVTRMRAQLAASARDRSTTVAVASASKGRHLAQVPSETLRTVATLMEYVVAVVAMTTQDDRAEAVATVPRGVRESLLSLRRSVLLELSAREPSLMGRNIYRSAASTFDSQLIAAHAKM